MIRALDLAASGEIATGLALVIAPSFVGLVLFGDALTGVAAPTARVAGIALIALGVACLDSGLIGMLTYSLAVTFYLAYLGLSSGFTGVLLWPAIGLHAILSILLWRSRAQG